MKLRNITDIEGLFNVIDQCVGKVELVGEDLRINLKSKISQYFSLTKMLCDDEIHNMELLTENAEDAKRIMEFLINY